MSKRVDRKYSYADALSMTSPFMAAAKGIELKNAVVTIKPTNIFETTTTTNKPAPTMNDPISGITEKPILGFEPKPNPNVLGGANNNDVLSENINAPTRGAAGSTNEQEQKASGIKEFIEKNKMPLIIGAVALIVVIGGVIYFKRTPSA